MWTKRTIAAVAVAGMTAAGVAGVAVAAGTDGQGGPQAQLDAWVSEGSVSAEDAEAFDRVREQLQGERQERQAEREAERQAHQEEIAAVIGISADELTERLQAGETLNEIAGDQADEVAALLTAHAEERLTEAQAAIPERVEQMMNGEGRGFGGPGGGPGKHGGGFGPGPGAEAESDA